MRQGNSVFGFVNDSFPDRWGRALLDRRERLAAQEEQRPVRTLSSYDYLVSIEDLTRMGGIRYHTENNGTFIFPSATYEITGCMVNDHYHHCNHFQTAAG